MDLPTELRLQIYDEVAYDSLEPLERNYAAIGIAYHIRLVNKEATLLIDKLPTATALLCREQVHQQGGTAADGCHATSTLRVHQGR